MKTIEIKDITKKYNGKAAIEKISFTVEAGHIIGLLGPNGAGKTTTMSIITGILAPDSGEVLFDGEKMTEANELAVKAKIGFLSEANPLYAEMLVGEYLAFVASMRGMKKQEQKEAIKRVVEETGIEDKLHQPIEELSKGYKQRVGLAQAIIHQPDLLILDEPTEGLDPNQRVMIRDLISNLGKERTVIISTHVLSEVQAMCDQLVILNQGKLVRKGSVAEISSDSEKGQRVELLVTGNEIEPALVASSAFDIVGHQVLDQKQKFTLVSTQQEDIRPMLFKLGKEKNWELYDLHEVAASLEDIFRAVTKEAK